MSLSTYLYFDGSCAEAFDHYKKVFDAREQCRQVYSEGPAEIFGDANPDFETTCRGDACTLRVIVNYRDP